MKSQNLRLVLPNGHNKRVEQLDFNSSNNLLLSRSDDGTVKVWELLSKIPIFSNHNRYNSAARFVPNSNNILILNDSLLELWNVGRNEVIKTMHVKSDFSDDFKFVGNNRLIIHGRGFACWDISGIHPELIWDISEKVGYSRSIDISPDKSMCVAASGNDILLIDVNSGNLLHTFKRHNRIVNCVQFSASEDKIVSGGIDGKIIIWDIKIRQAVTEIENEYSIERVAFVPNDTKVVTGNRRGKIQLWGIESKSLLDSVVTDLEYVSDILFAKDGVRFAACGGNILHPIGTDILIFNVTKFNETRRLTTLISEIDDFEFYDFSKDGTILHTFNNNESIKKIDLATLFTKDVLSEENDWISSFYASNDKDFVLAGMGRRYNLHMSRVHKVNLNNGDWIEEDLVYPFTYDFIHSIKVAEDAQRALFISNSGHIEYWNLEKKKSINEIHFGSESFFGFLGENINQVDFFRKRRLILAMDSTLVTGRLRVPRLWRTFPAIKNVQCFDISSDSKYAIVGGDEIAYIKLGNNEHIKFWTKTHEIWVSNLLFLKNNEDFISAGADGIIKKWNIHKNEPTGIVGSHDEPVIFIKLMPDGKTLYSLGRDNVVKFWDLETETPIINLIMVGNEPVMYTNENYYFCSRKVSKILSFTDGDKTYNFDQFDLVYNRPDIVLNKIPFIDEELVEQYYNAYLLRLKEAGVDESHISSMFEVPELKILNTSEIIKNQNNDNGGKVTIVFEATGVTSTLDKLNCWVNNVPIFGHSGKDISGNSKAIKDSISVTLSYGVNKIELSVQNKTFVQSNKSPLYVKYNPVKQAKPNLYILGIGISEYKSLAELPNTDNDIKSFINLINYHKDSFDSIHIHSLVNENVSINNIIEFQQDVIHSQVDDIVMIYYSGHGLLMDNKDLFLCFLDFESEYNDSTGMSFSSLFKLMDGIPSRKKLLFLNACNSGNEINSDEASKKMRTYFHSLDRSFGAMVIASSTQDQSSFTSSQSDFGSNSAFGYALNNIIKATPHISLNELASQLNEEVLKLTDSSQQPNIKISNLELDFLLIPAN